MTERRLVPAAERQSIRATAQQLCRMARDKMIERICEPETQALLWEAIKSRLVIGSRCAVCGQEGRAPRDGARLLAEIMGLVDAAPQLQLAITNYLNVTPEVAKIRVEMVAEVDEMDEATRFDLCLSYVLESAEQSATMRAELVKRTAAAMKLLPAGE